MIDAEWSGGEEVTEIFLCGFVLVQISYLQMKEQQQLDLKSSQRSARYLVQHLKQQRPDYA
jgi:hypothetical protein